MLDNTNLHNAFYATLDVFVTSSPNAIADVTVALSEMRVGINSITAKEFDSNMKLVIGIRCSGADHLKSIIGILKKIKNVREVVRGYQV